MVAVPGSDNFLLLEEPGDGISRPLNNTSLYNWRTGQATALPAPRHSHWGGGAALLASGDILLVGGSGAWGHNDSQLGLNVTQVLHSATMTWGANQYMHHQRWHPSAMSLPHDKVLICGGTTLPDTSPGWEKVSAAEVWDPLNPDMPATTATLPSRLTDYGGRQYYPTLQLMPQGDLLVWSDTTGSVVALPALNHSLLDLPPWPSEQDGILVPPNLHSTYPTTASTVLLPLLPESNYAMELLIVGGSVEPNTNNTIASRLSMRIGIGSCSQEAAVFAMASTKTGAKYCVNSGWQVEDMGMPRVMADAVLLPNGVVVILNGAQAGVAGFWTLPPNKPNFYKWRLSNSTRPVLRALLYDPAAPKGSRYSFLASTPLARMYHSSACLTPNGTVLVGGSDQTTEFGSDEYTELQKQGLLDPPPSRIEYRVEELIPPFVLHAQRPAINAAPEGIFYDTNFTVTIQLAKSTVVPSQDLRVVIVAPCSATHSINNQQRVVGLQVLGVATQPNGTTTLQARGPPASLPGLALHGMYMLFVVVGRTYSQAAWVTLDKPQPASALQPSGVYVRYPQPALTTALLMVAVPGTDQFIFLQEPGNDTSRMLNETSMFNWRTGEVTDMPASRHNHWCGGVTIMTSGDILLMGGSVAWGRKDPTTGKQLRDMLDGFNATQVFNRTSMSWGSYQYMRNRRWYPSATSMPDGKVLITGGTTMPDSQRGYQRVLEAELWDPASPSAPTRPVALPRYFMEDAGNQLYPTLQLTPQGDLLLWADTTGSVVEREGWSSLLDLTPWPSEQDGLVVPPNLHTLYPHAATVVLLPLLPETDYALDLLVLGGTVEPATNTTEASRLSFRIGIGACSGAGASGGAAVVTRKYCVTSGWQVEDMGTPRIMPDAVLLPNGVVVVLNGAKAGMAGFWTMASSLPGLQKVRFSNSTRPVLKAHLYDPEAPKGARYSFLAATTIPRMYHCSACLTPNGTVLAGGCDTSAGYNDPESLNLIRQGLLDPPPSRIEYRVEELIPPFILHAQRPAITAAPSSIQYDSSFAVNIKYEWPKEGPQQDVRVVIVSPCAVTHSINNQQRVVGLQVLGVATQPDGSATLQVRGPPASLPGLALRGWYMLFVVVGRTYSQAAWVVLESAPASAASPAAKPGTPMPTSAPSSSTPLGNNSSAATSGDSSNTARTLLASLLNTTAPYQPPLTGLRAAGLPPNPMPPPPRLAADGFDIAAFLEYQPEAARAVVEQYMHRGSAACGGGVTCGPADAMRVIALQQLEGSSGGSEGPPVCARIPTILSYSAYPDLAANLYASVTAWSIAAALGADVALLPAGSTLAPAHGPSSGAEEAGRGAGGHLHDDVYSSAGVSQLLSGLGVIARILGQEDLRPGEGDGGVGSAEDGSAARPRMLQGPQAAGGGARLNRRLVEARFNMTRGGAPGGAYTLQELLAVLQQEVVAAAKAFMASPRGLRACHRPPAVHLHLANPLAALRTSDLPLAAHLARGLQLSDTVHAAAQYIFAAMARLNVTKYNAIHLKAQPVDHTSASPDAAAAVDWQAYVAACQALGIGPDRPLYVASGLLRYSSKGRKGPAGQGLWDAVPQHLQPLGSMLLHQGALLQPPQPLNGSGSSSADGGGSSHMLQPPPQLTSEQAAAVDLLVLVGSERFLGARWSLLSSFVAQARLLHGMPPSRTSLVGQAPAQLGRDALMFLPMCDTVDCSPG